MKKLLWVGDAACPSGFAQATHRTLDTLKDHYDVTVLGINYRGDPYDYPYPIYAAAAGGDQLGINRLIWMCANFEPDLIVLQNDPWQIPLYLRQLQQYPEHRHIPVIASLAVDGKNQQGMNHLNGLALAIFWSEFGQREARKAGYTGPSTVIPLGVDLETYYPMDKTQARLNRKLDFVKDKFIVGNVNRNQPRKRWDLTIEYFAEWVKAEKIKDARLYFHTAPTGDVGCDVKQLTKYYGILDMLLLREPQVWYGDSDEAMRETYNCFDVQVSTTQGEGFGLTTFEGMACGVPQIVPDWAALGEHAKNAALLVPCTSTAIGWPYLNIIGGIADKAGFIKALSLMYHDHNVREEFRALGFVRVMDDKLRWPNIGERWLKELAQIEAKHTEIEWKDLGRPEEVTT
jgi:glycosyltransferase involved in cell wall biosynthesis